MSKVVIYGSYGFTGSLIAEEAIERGYEVVLAGRDGDELGAQAAALPVEDVRTARAALDADALDPLFEDATVVLHCAGPFARTWRPVVDACLRTGTHYCDVTGEIDVFEGICERDAEARDAGIMLLPGAGFDVAGTNCLAVHLANRLPDADRLEIGVHAQVGVSSGTVKTFLEHAHKGGIERRNGRLEQVPFARDRTEIPFGWEVGEHSAVSMPWGDVSTAYHATGIPNIETYMAMSPPDIRAARLFGRLTPVFRFDAIRRPLTWLADRTMTGPDDDELNRKHCYAWAAASRATGERVAARIRGPHTYLFTLETALLIVERILRGEIREGFQTPGTAYGSELILEIPGVEREDIA